MIAVHYGRGLRLPDLDLWLDPRDAVPRAFVSHAHADHIAAHGEVIASPGTARLMEARLGGRRREILLDFGATHAFENFQLTLLAAGHIFGSAQAFVESAEGSLLYTGDFKLRPGLSAEPATWCHAETLIMETTYGLPKYRMPPTADVLAQMVDFCREALEEDAVPVLLGYSLGKAQEILCALIAAGLEPMLHGAVHRMTEIYRTLHPDFPQNYERYAPEKVAGKVLVCPPSVQRSLMLTRIKSRRTAVLTGWALDPGAKFRYQCDAAFPLTDHADYPDLLRYVELVQPKRVLTLHGFAAAFAADLRARGIDALALSEANQLELTLTPPTVRSHRLDKDQPAKPLISSPISDREPARADRPEALLETQEVSAFDRFGMLGETLAATTSKLRKTTFLATYLQKLSPADLPLATRYLTGSAFAQTDPRVLQTGWAVIRRALRASTSLSEERFREISRAHADAGKTAYEVLLEKSPATQIASTAFSLKDSADFFDALQRARGPLVKGEILQQVFARVTALTGSYLVKIMTGDLRIGLKEGLVEEAIAEAFSEDISDVREAHMLLGDIGATALLACEHRLHAADLQLFRPIKCMLASPEPTAKKIWERLSSAGTHIAWAEEKYDGMRAQVHVENGRVEIFTRDLHCVTGQFADLVAAAMPISNSLILDGEILAFDGARRLTFFDLQKRFGRQTERDLFAETHDVPVIFKAFDLLFVDGVSLLRQPLADRRARLEETLLPPRFERAPVHQVDSVESIETAFRNARLHGNEGLMIKDENSFYTPGRRGLSWLKLKKELATLDVVVVGAEMGHGKRSHVLSDYTFAVRDETNGALLNIGKAYSGLTDVEIEQLTEHFQETTILQRGRFREVRPEIVLEIAFDSIQPSQRHASGLALRFPRIKAIRRDKSAAEIDTLTYARSLVAEKNTGSQHLT